MTKFKLSSNILVPILVLLYLVPFAYDIYCFYTDWDNLVAEYISEGMTILFGLLYFVFLINTFNFRDKSISENLKIFGSYSIIEHAIGIGCHFGKIYQGVDKS